MTDADLRGIMDNAGLSPEQQQLLDEGREFRDTFAGPSGATPATTELWRLGRKLVTDSGFTPEFRDAWDAMLASVEAGPGQGEAFQATLTALNKIVDSGGTEGAGILPLGEVVGVARALAGQRSAQIAKAAQTESVRRGLSPGAVTVGTEIGGEAAALQLSQEGQAYAAALQSHQSLTANAVSESLRNLTQLAQIERNDPVLGARANVLGDLIRATTTNIQTGFGALAGAEGAEATNRNQILQSLGISADIADSGQQNFLNAIGQSRAPGLAYLGLAGQAVGALGAGIDHNRGRPWWQDLIPGLLNWGLGQLNRPREEDPPPSRPPGGGSVHPGPEPFPNPFPPTIPPPFPPRAEEPDRYIPPYRPPDQPPPDLPLPTDPAPPTLTTSDSRVTYPGQGGGTTYPSWPRPFPDPFNIPYGPPGWNQVYNPFRPPDER